MAKKIANTEVLKKKTMTKKAYQETQKAQRNVSGFNTGTRNTDKNGKMGNRSGLSIKQQKHRNLRPERDY